MTNKFLIISIKKKNKIKEVDRWLLKPKLFVKTKKGGYLSGAK